MLKSRILYILTTKYRLKNHVGKNFIVPAFGVFEGFYLLIGMLCATGSRGVPQIEVSH
jgi:hypothetical protein